MNLNPSDSMGFVGERVESIINILRSSIRVINGQPILSRNEEIFQAEILALKDLGEDFFSKGLVSLALFCQSLRSLFKLIDTKSYERKKEILFIIEYLIFQLDHIELASQGLNEKIIVLSRELEPIVMMMDQWLLWPLPPLNLDLTLLRDYLTDGDDQIEQLEVNLALLSKNGNDVETIHAVFRAFHTLKSASGIVGVLPVEKTMHELESLFMPVRDGEAPLTEALVNLCFESLALIRLAMKELAEDGAMTSRTTLSFELLRCHITLFQKKTQGMPFNQLQGGRNKALETESSEEVHGHVRELIKVDPHRVNRLIENIGELVIAESLIFQAPDFRSLGVSESIQKQVSQMEKVTRQLHEIGLSMRMVSLQRIARKLQRIVREASVQLGKNVQLLVYGDDTELDRVMAEKIEDPLIHLVRNAIDHGIESSNSERTLRGKPEIGQITLRASVKGSSVSIEIEDDGRGITRSKLLKKAVEKGLIKNPDQLSERDILNLIFLPGISTADEISDLSGRGVGMDVVRKNIEEIRGQIEIKSTEGVGTLFTIRIPNTLAIIDGMIIYAANERYVIPTVSVVRSFKLTEAKIFRAMNSQREFLDLDSESIPLLRLSLYYGLVLGKNASDGIGSSTPPPTTASLGFNRDLAELVLIVEEDGQRIGLVVDGISRQHQFVTKGLECFGREVEGFSGGTILPDGQVGLILDIGSLLKHG